MHKVICSIIYSSGCQRMQFTWKANYCESGPNDSVGRLGGRNPTQKSFQIKNPTQKGSVLGWTRCICSSDHGTRPYQVNKFRLVQCSTMLPDEDSTTTTRPKVSTLHTVLHNAGGYHC